MWLDASTGNVSITNCIFQNNSATGGGAVVLNQLAVNISITNCTFQNNSATIGGAISISSVNAIIICNTTFSNNIANNGAAVQAQNGIIGVDSWGVPLSHLLLQDVVVKDNHCSGGGAISFVGIKVDIFGNTPTGSQFSSNSAQGAIQGQNGLLLLHGNITFKENRGVNGGAISLSNNVPLYFYEGCRVEFSRNVATGSGGAIYNDGEKNAIISSRGFSISIIRFIFNPFTVILQPSSFTITFTDNHAQQVGHAVYATPIYDCTNSFDNDIDTLYDRS